MALPKIQPYRVPSLASVPPARASWKLEPRRAALLIHDMQSYFLSAYALQSDPARSLLGGVERLRAMAHAAGVPVFYSIQPPEQTQAERGLVWDLWGPGMSARPGSDALAVTVTEVDRPILKRRYSAFFETSLGDELRALGRDQLIITGVYAHIGCLATATDAFSRDVHAFMVADAVADFSADDHAVALRQVARTCGVVTDVERVCAVLEAT